MAVKIYSALELNLILGQFAVSDEQYSFSPMTSGLINDTFLVSTVSKPLFILQRINHTVFENVSGLMKNLETALAHLHDESYTKLHLIQTKDGSSFYSAKEEPIAHWRLITFIAHTRTFDMPPDETVAFEAGRIIGKFHALLEESNPADYVNIIPKFHDLKFREEQFFNSLKTADPDKLAIAESAISFAKKTIIKLGTMQMSELPIRVCHNDTKLNNILFSKTTNKALCLIDLDTLMAGHFRYDFGDAVRTIANTAPEDEQDHKNISFEKSLFEAFVKGLGSTKKFLSKKEIQSLSSGIILMPFLHGIRALTDFLENNTYYKVSYQNQNLDRALSLFNFTKKTLCEIKDIEAIIHKYLSA